MKMATLTAAMSVFLEHNPDATIYPSMGHTFMMDGPPPTALSSPNLEFLTGLHFVYSVPYRMWEVTP